MKLGCALFQLCHSCIVHSTTKTCETQRHLVVTPPPTLGGSFTNSHRGKGSRNRGTVTSSCLPVSRNLKKHSRRWGTWENERRKMRSNERNGCRSGCWRGTSVRDSWENFQIRHAAPTTTRKRRERTTRQRSMGRKAAATKPTSKRRHFNLHLHQ